MNEQLTLDGENVDDADELELVQCLGLILCGPVFSATCIGLVWLLTSGSYTISDLGVVALGLVVGTIAGGVMSLVGMLACLYLTFQKVYGWVIDA